jgi:hypothetical protein
MKPKCNRFRVCYGSLYDAHEARRIPYLMNYVRLLKEQEGDMIMYDDKIMIEHTVIKYINGF